MDSHYKAIKNLEMELLALKAENSMLRAASKFSGPEAVDSAGERINMLKYIKKRALLKDNELAQACVAMTGENFVGEKLFMLEKRGEILGGALLAILDVLTDNKLD